MDAEFRKRSGETIENYLSILNGTSADWEVLYEVWRFEHEDDFVCEFIVGQLDGLILGYFRGIHDRVPIDEESREIREIVESFSEQIRTLAG